MRKSKAAGSDWRPDTVWAILLCFFASGVSGLVYQVVWVRELVLVFGATTFAVSTVLTAFMGGLALGSYYFGRRSETVTRPLRLYGLLEIGIGVYSLAVPLIFATLPTVYHSLWSLHLSFFALSIIRFIFATLVLIVPTALMGATLPILSSFYARDIARIGLRVGSLYAINTFGAVLGAAATGFVLIPLLGMKAATSTAATMNILLGVVALLVSRRVEREPSVGESGAEQEETETKRQRPAPREPHPIEISVVIAGFAVSGFVALSYEVIWSRVLALIIGSSVYAFSIMLTTFLIGLAAGATIASRFVDRIRSPIRMFALIEVCVGATSLAGAYVFNDLPYVFVQLYRWVDSNSFGLILFGRFLIASFVMIVPTLLLGSLFPLVVKIISSRKLGRATGRTVGDAYAANTLGAIAGSFASGFIMVPWLGLLGSLRLCVALNFLVAGVAFTASAQRSGTRNRSHRIKSGAILGVAASVLLIVVVVLGDPPWDPEVMSSAVYRYAPSLANKNRQELFDFLRSGQGETIFYKEGITATVAVQSQAGGRVLKVNGKPEASTAGDMPTQILIGALPLLVREHTDDVLLIGLGSGVTLGSVEQFPVKRVTCVELEPAVVEASKHFQDVNNSPLDDPRLRMISNDGRNFIYTTDEKFDVIVSEPSNPWVTGVANLFTLEYFKKGAERLKDDGLFSQWLQIYEMSPDDVRTLIATFRAAFPQVYLFRGAEGDLMLLGSKNERRLDLSVLKSHFETPTIATELKRISTSNAADLISRYYLGPADVTRLSAGAKLNTDDNALIEFNAPRRVGTAEETVVRNLNQLLAYAASPLDYVDSSQSSYGTGGGLLTQAALCALKRDDRERAEQFVNYSLQFSENAQAHGILGELKQSRGDEAGAIEAWQAALALDPNHFFTLIDLGKTYLTKQDLPRAIPYLDRAIQADPSSARAHHLRGLAYQAAGDHQQAALEYRKALPDVHYTRSIPNFYLNFGTALMQINLYPEAAQMLEEFIKLSPNDFEGHFQLGAAYEIQSERTLDDALTKRAVEELKLALSIQPKHARAHYYLSKAYRRLEQYDLAEAEFELYESLYP
ncbi:MAG TPA: fused MFS/spermidine synthase [Blastocatellia bacterium]|nr:fused MFS/spermidine synthase [Blastocatellia bacterium]